MELLYVNKVMDDKQLDEEVFIFVVNYLISEKIYMHSNVGFGLKYLKNIDYLTDDEVLKYFEIYLLSLERKTKDELLEELSKMDSLKANLKNYKQLKHRNQLPSGHFKHLQLLKASYIRYRKIFKGFLNEYLHLLGVFQYYELYDEELIKVSFSEINRDWEYNYDILGELIYDNMLNHQNMLLLEDFSNLENFTTNTEVEEEDKKLYSDYFILHNIPLVTIPCSSSLQLNELVVLRQKFLNNFTVLFTKILSFRSDINKIDKKEAIIKKVEEIKSEIKIDLEKLQSEIDNNLYFMKIKNSDSDYTNVTICVGVLTNLMILHFFSGRELISPEKYLELEYRLSEKVTEKLYDLFIYYKIDLDINKYNFEE